MNRRFPMMVMAGMAALAAGSLAAYPAHERVVAVAESLKPLPDRQRLTDYHRTRKPRANKAGWSVAEGKRRARKARNRARHKRACGRRSRK